MHVLSLFDPWKHELCTCPKKYSFNPYTGCAHACDYCYATYIPDFFRVRTKKNIFEGLSNDLEKLGRNALISMSNSSDPYPVIEKKLKITRKCIEIMKNFDVKLLVITKSDIVKRDIDILSELKCAVAITITGFSTKIFEKFSPFPEKRIETLKTLKDCEIPVILRLDPLMPWIDKSEWIKVIEKCYFVDHVVTSTLKLRKDSIARILKTSPKLKSIINELYLKRGEKIRNSFYLEKSLRKQMLSVVAEKCSELGISCSFCREGFEFNAKTCDGSHLIK